MFNRWRRGAWLAVVVAATVAFASCKPGAESAREHPAKTVKKVALGPNEPTNALPPDLFKNMPMFPGIKVVHVRRPKGHMREILFETDGDFDKLVSFYKQQLSANGFNITNSLIMRAVRKWSCDFSKKGRLGSFALYPSLHEKSKMVLDLIYELPSKANEAMMAPIEKFDVIGPGPVPEQAAGSVEKNEKTKRN